MRSGAKSDKDGFKYARIKTDLSIQILEGQLRPHDQIPSLNDITQKYKVSKITARRVLNDLVTEGLAYTSPGRGSFVADAASRVKARKAGIGSAQLGVVFEHAAGSFMSGIIMGIDEEAFSLNVQINLCISNNSYEREAENLQRLANQGIDKILLFMVLDNEENTMNPNIPLYLRLQEQGIRIYLLVCNIPGFPIPSVTYDDYNASRSLVKFLKEKNCRRLVHVSRLDNASTTIERIRGFKDGLLEHNLSYDERRIVRVKCADVDSVVTDASSRFGEFLKNGDLVDAVVCSDELVAAGVFDALDKMGIPPRSRPIVGGMGCLKNVHVLKGNPYILAEDDTYRLGREAAHAALMGEFPTGKEKSAESFRRVIPVPLRIPKSLR